MPNNKLGKAVGTAGARLPAVEPQGPWLRSLPRNTVLGFVFFFLWPGTRPAWGDQAIGRHWSRVLAVWYCIFRFVIVVSFHP